MAEVKYHLSRREALSRMSGALATLSNAGKNKPEASRPLIVAGRNVELAVTIVSPQTLRLRLQPPSFDTQAAQRVALPHTSSDGLVLVKRDWPAPAARLKSVTETKRIEWGTRQIVVSTDPPTVEVWGNAQKLLQRLQVHPADGAVSFALGNAPIFGLGEGGQQFDRRGGVYKMEHGQHEPSLEVLGARVSIPLLVSAEGWALFLYQPLGPFDLRSNEGGLPGNRGRFLPADAREPLPLDLFVILADPPGIFLEYSRLTGFPHLPPIWALGYQQSHRTLASREEVLAEAKTFREKKLPCDVMIFLGTGFCPSGWNTGHGSFTFNERVFPDPAVMIEELHNENFKFVPHVVLRRRDLHGRVREKLEAGQDAEHVANYWKTHLETFRMGVDGWWPDEGDWLTPAACLIRNRMYWEGPQMERPNVRPYALHRNGYVGIQRYGWLWSGDIESTWETLRAQVQVGINIGLSGIPFWGTDTGGFVTTPEFTGELYVRWFQFSAFCPLFRSHGRTWKLHLPWGWNTDDYGPTEISGYGGRAGLPDRKELHNAEVEPICRKYLDLRYRLMPYTYTVVREAHDTGLPVMRGLWVHYADDPRAVERSDEYLWGRDILVAPVTERGATSRALYLPRGLWYDFWTEQPIEGQRVIIRPVDLASMPLYVRAGSILPFGSVNQYALQKAEQPLTFAIYSGADGEFTLYEDDGASFNCEKGEFTRLRLQWQDRDRRLTLALAGASRVLEAGSRIFKIRIAGNPGEREVRFEGNTQTIHF
jgi:alpha-glucosidase (family GH31 glycosyl hydrolase)